MEATPGDTPTALARPSGEASRRSGSGLGTSLTNARQIGMDRRPHPQTAPSQALANCKLQIEERDSLHDQQDEERDHKRSWKRKQAAFYSPVQTRPTPYSNIALLMIIILTLL